MILTCPACATSYFIPDDVLGANGRKVRCKSCGEVWRASPDEPLELSVAPEPRRRTVANEGQAGRVEPVQRRELAGGVPPLVGDARKALDLGWIDRGTVRVVRGLAHGYP